jgi:trans-aconitate methyltransferase
VSAEPEPTPAPTRPGESRPADGAPVGASGLRPFLLTSGRTTADVSIAIETQVISTDDGRDKVDTLTFERRDIVALCEEPLALAEIAAMLELHLGVVRVLVGDLSTEGLLAVYLPDADVAQDVDTLLRVIRGLRAIS